MSIINIATNFKDLREELNSLKNTSGTGNPINPINYLNYSDQPSQSSTTLSQKINSTISETQAAFELALQLPFSQIIDPFDGTPLSFIDGSTGLKFYAIQNSNAGVYAAIAILEADLPGFMRGIAPLPSSIQSMTIRSMSLYLNGEIYQLNGSVRVNYHFDQSGSVSSVDVGHGSTISLLSSGIDPNTTLTANTALTYNGLSDIWTGTLASVEKTTYFFADSSNENEYIEATQNEKIIFSSAISLFQSPNDANAISANNTTTLSSYTLKLDQNIWTYNPNTDTETKSTKNLVTETITGLPTVLNINSILNDNLYSNFVSGNDTITVSSTSTFLDPNNSNQPAPTTIDGGMGNDIITGTEYNDIINGEQGNDTLKGGGGDDILITGTGTDNLDGGNGNDTAIFANTFEAYAISKTATSVTLSDPSGSTTVSNIESFSFNAGTQFLTLQQIQASSSSSGDDILYRVGSGTYANNAFTQDLNYSGPAAVFDGSLGNDKLFGTEFNDTLLGGDGNDTLTGFGGNDYLDGGSGTDAMIGGNGDDFYVVDSIVDTIQEGLGQGVTPGPYPENKIQVKGAISYVLASGQAIGWLSAGSASKLTPADTFWTWDYSSSTSATNIKGNEFGQWLIGNAAANKLEGMAGDDTLSGEAGNDTLDGGDGNDGLLLGKGDDTLLGGKGDDTFVQYETINNVLNPTPNLIHNTGKDNIDGGDGIDTLNLQKAEINYTINKSGSDLVFTDKITAGNIVTVKNNVEFVAFEGINPIAFSDFWAAAASTGDDVLYNRGSGSYNFATQTFTPNFAFIPNGSLPTIDGLAGNDKLFGSLYADTLTGGLGNDTLNGFSGADTLVGGDGNDTLTITPSGTPSANPVTIELNGGLGDDSYVLDGFDLLQRVHITDTSGTDTLIINNYGYTNSGGIMTPNNLQIKPVIENSNLVIYASGSLPSPTASPLLTVASGASERLKINEYKDPLDLTRVTKSLDYKLIYANLSSGNWNAKGSDGADIIMAMDDNNADTNDGNIFDGGKGDDLIWFKNSASTVVMGGEGFNTLNLYTAMTQSPINAAPQEPQKATLSYAWAVGTAEVNIAAGVGLAYDAAGQDIVGFDQFNGFGNILGSKQNDMLVGDANINRLDGSDGNDSLNGGGGDDILVGGKGDDRLEVGTDSSVYDFVQLLGSEGNDTYYVALNSAATVVSERTGGTASYSSRPDSNLQVPDNIMYGNLELSGGTDAGGNDTLIVGGITSVEDLQFYVKGSTVSIGLPNTDPTQLLTHPINAGLLVDRSVEKIGFDFGSGANTVYSTTWGNIGTKGSDLVIANSDDVFEYGGQGDDLVIGSSGNDYLSGGLGNDILIGRQGADRLLGNAGGDTLYVNAGEGDIAMGGNGIDTFLLQDKDSVLPGEISRIIDFKLTEDFLKFDNVTGIKVTLANDLIGSKGDISGTNFADVHINSQGYLSATSTGGVGDDALNIGPNELQIIGLVGVNNQQGLNTLMDHMLFCA